MEPIYNIYFLFTVMMCKYQNWKIFFLTNWTWWLWCFWVNDIQDLQRSQWQLILCDLMWRTGLILLHKDMNFLYHYKHKSLLFINLSTWIHWSVFMNLFSLIFEFIYWFHKPFQDHHDESKDFNWWPVNSDMNLCAGEVIDEFMRVPG